MFEHMSDNDIINEYRTIDREIREECMQTFCEYNIRDVELVDRLDAKLKLLELAFTIAYFAKVNYEDVYSPVKTWDVIIYNYLNERQIAIPIQEFESKGEAFEGAFVKDPLVGKHKWCASFDLNSLYPHLIIQYNMSPETITEIKIPTNIEDLLAKKCDLSEAHDNNVAVAANGWCFKKDKQGVIPTQMQRFYDLRVGYKTHMLETKQKLEDVESELKSRGAL